MSSLVRDCGDSLARYCNNPNLKGKDEVLGKLLGLINSESEGPQKATKILIQYLQSPRENEALSAINILEFCVAKGGVKLHNEIGRFRFLNEIVKLVSYKYLGECTPQAVKDRLIKLIYAWTKELDEPKIKEAYEMLKRQKVIIEDPAYVPSLDTKVFPDKTIFEDEEKTKLLKKLLQSKNNDDLSAANRLIKSMVREDELRVEKQVERSTKLESVNNNAKVLNDMLNGYSENRSSLDDIELMKELYTSCINLRSEISKIAAETECRSNSINEVLLASDDINHVIERYEGIVIKKTGDPVSQGSSNLLDLDLGPQESKETKNLHVSDDLYDIFSTPNSLPSEPDTPYKTLSFLLPTPVSDSNHHPTESDKGEVLIPNVDDNLVTGLSELDLLSQDLLKQSLDASTCQEFNFNKGNKKLSMNAMKSLKTKKVNIPLTENMGLGDTVSLDDKLVDLQPEMKSGAPVTMSGDFLQQPLSSYKPNPAIYSSTKTSVNLEEIDIGLKDIQPSMRQPVTMFTGSSIEAKLHYVSNKPVPDVDVFVIIITSRSNEPLSDYILKVVLPKAIKYRLLSPSTTDLQSYNAFLPPPTISSILLIENGIEECFSLQFVCSYTLGEELQTHTGRVSLSSENNF